MKRYKILLGVLGLAALAAGCSIMNPVPQTKFRATIGGQQFSYSNPKQACATNIVMSVSTNGTATMTIGAITSVNDPVVVDKSYAGAAMLVNAVGAQIQSNLNTAAQNAGTAAGAALKAP